MANQLKMDKAQAIRLLAERGWSRRRIARELGIHHTTVARYVQASKPTKVPAGSGLSKPTKVPTGSEGLEGSPDEAECEASRSFCEPFRELILEKLGQGLSAQRIYQDLVAEHDFGYAYDSVKRYVRRLQGGGELPYRRLECEPGQEAQVDFGRGAPVVEASGRRRRPHVLRVVLSCSRKGYSEAVDRQTTDNFIRCLENAFWHFGGAPQTLVLDNLRAAVTKADWFDPELNPKVRSFGDHYGVAILPTRPRMPRHKGKVERGVDYVQENGLKGHQFSSIQEENQHLLDWETNVADTRIHGTTRKQVGRFFQEVERPALQTLPLERFPSFREAQRIVHRDGHVAVAKACYSVPPEYLGRDVWVRWDSRLVRIFDAQMDQIALHARQAEGGFSTQNSHIATEKINGVERGATYWLSRVSLIGDHTRDWAAAMLQARGVEGVRVLMGLEQLARKYKSRAIERACELALAHGAYRLRTLRQLIERQGDKQQQFDFVEDHPVIRPLITYSQFVQSAFRKEPVR
ncbi:MAG: IS21 family transposase [Planctomycetes bacterium]|nr:IS21 family transposase [Planctomycetota bacterium]